MGTNSKLKGTVSAAYSRSNKPGCATLVDISGLFKENVDGRGVDSPPMQLRLRNVPILNSPYRTPTNKGGQVRAKQLPSTIMETSLTPIPHPGPSPEKPRRFRIGDMSWFIL